jgi:hypothetical protein
MAADHVPAALDRRGFLKLGAGGTAAFALLGAGVQLAGCSQQTARAADGFRWLTEADLAFARLLVAGVAGSALPADAAAAQAMIDEGVRRADLCLDALGTPAQKELRKLFDLVQWGPFRRFAGGVSSPWNEAGVADMQQLLTNFAGSRLALLNGAYRALAKTGSIVFWSQPAAYPAAHYPGPPAWAVGALNAA